MNEVTSVTTSFEPAEGLHLMKYWGPVNVTCDISTVGRAIAVLNEVLTTEQEDGNKRRFLFSDDHKYQLDKFPDVANVIKECRVGVIRILHSLLVSHPRNSKDGSTSLPRADFSDAIDVRNYVACVTEIDGEFSRFDVPLSEVITDFWNILRAQDSLLAQSPKSLDETGIKGALSVILSTTLPTDEQSVTQTTSVPTIAPAQLRPQVGGRHSMTTRDLDDDPAGLSYSEFGKFENQAGGAMTGFDMDVFREEDGDALHSFTMDGRTGTNFSIQPIGTNFSIESVCEKE